MARMATMKPDGTPNRFCLRIACVGAVDAKEVGCNGSIILSFDMISDDDTFTDALWEAGWYASVCDMPPDIGGGIGQLLCPLCPRCAAHLLPKEVFVQADKILKERKERMRYACPVHTHH
jgi:hypothetical protein